MIRMSVRSVLLRLMITAVVLTSAALSPKHVSADDAGIEFFEKKIRPILVQHCLECHGANSKKLGGNLRLDSRQGMHTGGDSGPALEPGKPDVSLLISAVKYGADSIQMPPKGKLPDALIADLETWVKMGAPDPRESMEPARPTSNWAEILRTRRNWWSLQPIQSPPIPEAKTAWSTQPIDRFILAKLAAESLSPGQPASAATLARRLGLAITGLPPTVEQAQRFIRASGAVPLGERLPEATVAAYVDELLASPHFGERWARHWMDIVRFTETHGNEWNYEVHHAWQYRDYLIRALNNDVPYDQLIREHIAGDLLPQQRWNPDEKFRESPIGTAFYRFGEVNHDDCISLRELGYDLLDNQIDTLSKAFQATTIACARCHDHKLDAVSAADYYGLLGILRSSRLVGHTLDSPEVIAAPAARLKDLKSAIRTELSRVWLEDVAQIPAIMAAAVAKKTAVANAGELAQGLDPARLEKWLVALNAEKAPLEDPLEPWRKLTAAGSDPAPFSTAWTATMKTYADQDRERTVFNTARFETYADFRTTIPAEWQQGGLGLSPTPSPSGDFALHGDGDAIVKTIFPAGVFSSTVSERLNGTLRSPVLPQGKAHISFQVAGERSSALRLVSNHCQLNYKNYRALTSAELQWITFSPPEDRDSLRTYAELMTMFDNPKFPDQLAALGGDSGNYKLPWDEAAKNPRSWWGITRVVLHDSPEPPQPELSPLRRVFEGTAPTTMSEVAGRYAQVMEHVIQAWSENRATDDDIHWLEAFLRRELLRNHASASPKLASLIEEYRKVEQTLPLPRVTPGLADSGSACDQPIFIRGDCHRPGQPTARRYLEVLADSREPIATTGSGRLELADRIADKNNPLTARVMVNRVWHHLFGAGIVRSVDDFGHVGDLPSHPELLDHLATQFMEDGWSIKRLIRSIVLTRTFQQTSDHRSSDGMKIDPENRMLWHYPARRMEAEAIRDAILATSGRLDRTLFGHSVQPFRESPNADRRLFPGPLDGNGRRSVYIKNNLMESPRFLSAFNFPGGKVTQGKRDATNVPAQALALLNDPFVLQQADVWSTKLVQHTAADPTERVRAMFHTALGRPPSGAEEARFVTTLDELAQLRGVAKNDVMKTPAVWQDLAHILFNLQEFLYIP